jgi:2,4-dienoyl-CoA reductase-like NADH-dependent reductase (Old Yellow Enzyme family)
MPGLFEPISIGSLHLRNRMMRSATAERMADPQSGAPLPKLAELYRELALGGIGLIVTGHIYVDRGGKAHPEMAALDSNDLIPAWRDVIGPAQTEGARVMVQINHGGASCDPVVTPPLSLPLA